MPYHNGGGNNCAYSLLCLNDAWAKIIFINSVVDVTRVFIIGERAIVGANAGVYNDVESMTIVGGNPAKMLKQRQ